MNIRAILLQGIGFSTSFMAVQGFYKYIEISPSLFTIRGKRVAVKMPSYLRQEAPRFNFGN